MALEEAREFYSNQTHYFADCEEAKKDQECRKIINEALEKQIPKKYKTNEFGDYVCPSCGIDIPRSIYNVNRMSTTVTAGCPFCLQVIDWSNEKEWLNEGDKVEMKPRIALINTTEEFEKTKEEFEGMCLSHPCTECKYINKDVYGGGILDCFYMWLKEEVEV